MNASAEIVDHLAELTRHRDRELLDTTLASAFRSLLAAESVAIYRRAGDASDERWTLRALLGPGDTLARSDPPWMKLRELPPLASFPARCEALSGRSVVTELNGRHHSVFPLATDRDVVGVVEFETKTQLSHESHKVIGSMLHVYRNFETLLDYSERDTLTGLLNRKTFEDAFYKISMVSSEAMSANAGDHDTSGAHDPYFVAMIDIDFFKSVNDKHGHLIGDEVLLLQSRLMRSSFRFQDRLYRFGGEEFVVLMRCTDSVGALRAVERLRANTANYLFPRVGQVTISVGVTQIRPGDSPSAALGRADQAVYFAKANGRNQAHAYEVLLARGAINGVAEEIGEIDLF